MPHPSCLCTRLFCEAIVESVSIAQIWTLAWQVFCMSCAPCYLLAIPLYLDLVSRSLEPSLQPVLIKIHLACVLSFVVCPCVLTAPNSIRSVAHPGPVRRLRHHRQQEHDSRRQVGADAGRHSSRRAGPHLARPGREGLCAGECVFASCLVPFLLVIAGHFSNFQWWLLFVCVCQ